jgi:hypothetical protein
VICSSAIGFDPRVDGERLTFGFEGIWQGTAVLYDHQTGSLWMHITGECFQGTHAGVSLRPLPTGRHTTWADWRGLHPATEVLALDPALVAAKNGHGYFDRRGARSGDAFFPPTFPGTIEVRDARLDDHALLLGVEIGRAARAYPFERLAERPVRNDELGGVALTVWFDKPSRSAAAYRRDVAGRTLTFQQRSGGEIVDRETGSRWTMEGRAVSGPLAGTQLGRVRSLMSEWYGWRASYPDTSLAD